MRLGPSLLTTCGFVLCPVPQNPNEKAGGSAAERGVSSAAPDSGQDPAGLWGRESQGRTGPEGHPAISLPRGSLALTGPGPRIQPEQGPKA